MRWNRSRERHLEKNCLVHQGLRGPQGPSAIVLASLGLTVDVEFTELSRTIFRSIKVYGIHRTASTLQILVERVRVERNERQGS